LKRGNINTPFSRKNICLVDNSKEHTDGATANGFQAILVENSLDYLTKIQDFLSQLPLYNNETNIEMLTIHNTPEGYADQQISRKVKM